MVTHCRINDARSVLIRLEDGELSLCLRTRGGAVAQIKGDITTVQKEATAVDVPTEGFLSWINGRLIQDALPDAPRSVREFLQSGMTPEEWGRLCTGLGTM